MLTPHIRGKCASGERTGASGSTRKPVFWQTVVNDERPKLYNGTNEWYWNRSFGGYRTWH